MVSNQVDEQAIFSVARKISDARAQSDYLQQVCGDNTALLARVRALLQVTEQRPEFLESPPSDVEATADIMPVVERPGLVIDNYRLMEQIGEGGMGVVYVAEQDKPIRRRVALKVIKPGMDTKEVVARFEAERQALALMDHPNIAKVHDAGTTESGRPFFVMELVRGIPITKYCDLNKLDAAGRLQLFIDVCHAVQHAHQKGVIHRDLKPSNVLITEHDGTPVVKVIDFGVAKAINQQLTERTIYTRHQQMVGTPMYMSPEQAELSGLDVDTRSDIYSLGVLLYELLTGTTPFDKQRFSEAAYDEVRRIIREEEPSKPSTKVRTLGDTDTISGYRKTDLATLSQSLRGDLDWIVMKSLEKDRNRRYDTAKGLANDIERHLNDEPVVARPPSAGYQFQKFARRHKTLLTSASLVSLALIIGTGVATWMAIVADRAREEQRRLAQFADRQAKVAQANAAKEADAREQALRSAAEAEQAALLEAAAREETRRLLYASDTNVAQQLWEDGKLSQMVSVLERHDPAADEKDLRGFEWYHLWRLTQQAASVSSTPLEQPVYFLSMSPDGNVLAAASGSEVLLYDTEAPHRLVHSFPTPHEDRIEAIVFSPKHPLLVTVGGGQFILWDVRDSTNPVTMLNGQGSRAVAFSPSGSNFAVANGEEVTLWQVDPQPEQVKKLELSHSVKSLALSENALVITGDPATSFWLVDLAEDATPREVGAHTAFVTAVAFCPDGDLLATAGHDGLIKLWDVATKQEVGTLEGHRGQVWSIEFGPDGTTLASIGADTIVRLWDVPQRRLARALRGHAFAHPGRYLWRQTDLLAFSPHDGLLVSTAADNKLKWWGLAESKEMEAVALRGHSHWIQSVEFSPDGKTLASGTRSGEKDQLILWDVESGRELRRIENLASPVWHAKFSPHGRLLAFDQSQSGALLRDLETWQEVSNEKELTVWDIASGVALPSLPGDLNGLKGPFFSADWKLVASVDKDGKIVIRQTDGLKLVTEFVGQPGARYYQMTFSPDGQTLFAKSGSGATVYLWNAATGETQGTLEHTTPIWKWAISPDGTTLAACGYDGTVTLWNLLVQANVATLKAHNGAAVGAAFSPDGRVLATGGADATIRLWRAAPRQERRAAD